MTKPTEINPTSAGEEVVKPNAQTEFCANCEELIVFSAQLKAWYHWKTGVQFCGGWTDKWTGAKVAELKL